jgi:hypothetical protein
MVDVLLSDAEKVFIIEIKFSPYIYQPGDEIKLLRRVQGAE